MSFSVAWLADFFAEESKLIACGENAYKSNHKKNLDSTKLQE